MKRRILLALACLAASSLVSSVARAGIFLETVGPAIQGEATQVGFEQDIQILAGSFGATNPACSGGKGQVSLSEFFFSKETDRSSVDLLAAVRDHSTFSEFAFRFTRDIGGSEVVYQTFRFANVVVSSASASASDGAPRQSEAWSISFGQVIIEYTYFDGQGKAAGTESVTIVPAACPGS